MSVHVCTSPWFAWGDVIFQKFVTTTTGSSLHAKIVSPFAILNVNTAVYHTCHTDSLNIFTAWTSKTLIGVTSASTSGTSADAEPAPQWFSFKQVHQCSNIPPDGRSPLLASRYLGISPGKLPSSSLRAWKLLLAKSGQHFAKRHRCPNEGTKNYTRSRHLKSCWIICFIEDID